MSVGFGLIGSGFMAHTYAQCLAQHVPDGHLVAVAEGTRAPALAAEYGVDHVATTAELLARDDVDAALICTPHSTHRALTEAAAAAGKHVYIEKPMAVTLADCDAMITVCREARVLLDVNHVTRHRASPVAAKKLIDDGSIGELRIVRILSSVVAYLTDDHGWAHKAGEGGAWLDMGVHLFDALRWFTDSEVEVIFAKVRDFAGDPNQCWSGLAEVVMRNGVMVQMLISFEVPKPGLGSQSQWTFIGSDGIVESEFVWKGAARARRQMAGHLRDATVRAQRGCLQPDPAGRLRGPDAAVRSWRRGRFRRGGAPRRRWPGGGRGGRGRSPIFRAQ